MASFGRRLLGTVVVTRGLLKRPPPAIAVRSFSSASATVSCLSLFRGEDAKSALGVEFAGGPSEGAGAVRTYDLTLYTFPWHKTFEAENLFPDQILMMARGMAPKDFTVSNLQLQNLPQLFALQQMSKKTGEIVGDTLKLKSPETNLAVKMETGRLRLSVQEGEETSDASVSKKGREVVLKPSDVAVFLGLLRSQLPLLSGVTADNPEFLPQDRLEAARNSKAAEE
uniref:Uncharacterized protein n=1 Tax=Chromera velia CCMP2878 TaxID=1169474 RepID=A0A0G4GD55_9ALVE|mmetsp:Transcript_36733/g.72287  ORF Transcript_36733/g.72287 Transcript_36733/m.72287 type:complete len:226 (+) Transcript_36733:228-905(+)|eukprot:Cvel_21372.t1-p1 / transcript=Cvel_21372.t1 / gene=Cvel_21372 / organism=Chromera_velia_CCMP2878 / gene_product=hypothetical protein / transcript_product=hypothetical protein / location=Cvel_scaffold1999:5247-5921(-) / protein_length=225 / sequence_SO=supercontig / SO=protein_coding / is_pseudo=false